MPLGFELHAESFGLTVSYETAETQLPSKKQKSIQSPSNSVSASFDMGSSIASLSKTISVVPNNELKLLNFSDCMINKVSYQKFILKNLSGIKTKFKLSSLKFEPLSHVAPSKRIDAMQARLDDSVVISEQESYGGARGGGTS